MAPGTHWSDLSFKSVNLKSMGAPVGGGTFHPLLKVRQEFRTILMQMGFEEMPTNKWVESSFWNFDALFQPQSHPARDAHDTFFIKDPATTISLPEDYYEVLKNSLISLFKYRYLLFFASTSACKDNARKRWIWQYWLWV